MSGIEVDEGYFPRVGDLLEMFNTVTVRVVRVSKSGQWADIRCQDGSGFTWSKRQPLPWRVVGARLIEQVSA